MTTFRDFSIIAKNIYSTYGTQSYFEMGLFLCVSVVAATTVATGLYSDRLFINYISYHYFVIFGLMASTVFSMANLNGHRRLWPVVALSALPTIIHFGIGDANIALLCGEVASASLGCACLLADALRTRKLDQARLFLLGVAIGLGPIIGMEHLRGFNSNLVSYDGAMYNLDQFFFLHISCLVDRIVNLPTFGSWGGFTPLAAFVFLGYASTPLAMAAMDVAVGVRSDRMSLVGVFLLSGAIGAICYVILPVVGPQTIDGYNQALYTPKFESHDGLLNVSSGIPNCMPSLHATWALIILANTRRIGNVAIRSAFALDAVAQILGTLTIGDHWFLDLIVAVPFAGIFQSLCLGPKIEAFRALICAANVATWFIFIETNATVFAQSPVTQVGFYVLIVLTLIVGFAQPSWPKLLRPMTSPAIDAQLHR